MPPSGRPWAGAPARWLGAAVSGALAAQSFPSPDLGVLAWVALVPLLAALEGVTPAQGARLGFLQGAVFYALLVPWVVAVVSRYGGLGWPVAVLVGALLVAVLSLFHAAFGALQAWLASRLGAAALFWAPSGWVVLAEWIRLWPAGGFPWGYLGYTQHRSIPLLRLAAVGGVFGLSWAIVASNALLYGAMRRALWAGGPAARAGALGTAATALIWPMGLWCAGWMLPAATDDGTPIPVAAVQGNVPQEEKWTPKARQRILERHLDLTRQAASGGARLIVWPESSTVDQLEDSSELRDALQRIADVSGAALVVGSVHRQPRDGYTNAAFLLEPGRGLTGRYDKVRLVPFGETVPLRRFLFFVTPLVQAVGEFVPGRDLTPLGGGLRLAGEASTATPFGVAICYEITYPELVATEVRRGASFLVSLTNDAWFGRSGAAAQHFAMAVFRAAETRRWLVRAANSGISGVVSPDGDVRAVSALFVTALIRGEIRARTDLTPAVRHPQASATACVTMLVAAIAAAAIKPRTRSPGRG